MSSFADSQAGASFSMDLDADGVILRVEGDTFGSLGLSTRSIEGLALAE